MKRSLKITNVGIDQQELFDDVGGNGLSDLAVQHIVDFYEEGQRSAGVLDPPDALSADFWDNRVRAQQSVQNHPSPSRSHNSWHFEYVELAGKGHWFEGVMSTSSLKAFYRKYLKGEGAAPLLPQRFSFRVPNTAMMGSRGGFVVDQLLSPDEYGELEVFRDEGNKIWHVTTLNILRFHISLESVRSSLPLKLVIDGRLFAFAPEIAKGWYVREQETDNEWKFTEDNSWRSLQQRHGRQRGGLDAVMLTNGAITVVSSSIATDHTALEIARNLFQYYAADSEVYQKHIPHSRKAQSSVGNIITVATGPNLGPSKLSGYPIRVEGDRLILRWNGTAERHYPFETGLGAVFLRPFEDERLELVVWGADDGGLRQAARLVPTLTGSGQPDFVVTSDECRWNGLRGVYAAGFLDSWWKVSRGSFVK